MTKIRIRRKAFRWSRFERLEERTLFSAVLAAAGDSFINSLGGNGLGGPFSDHTNPGFGVGTVDPKYTLGLRYTRNELRPSTSITPTVSLYQQTGIKTDEMISMLWTDPYIRPGGTAADALTAIDGASTDTQWLASIEGNNEPDIPVESGDPVKINGVLRYPNSTQNAATNQTVIYAAAKSDPKLITTPILSWAPAYSGDYQGYTSTALDYEAMHPYAGAGTISQALLTGGNFIATTHTIQPPGSPTKPQVITETGYPNMVTDSNKINHDSSLAQAKQDTMYLAQAYATGIQRTYLYGGYGAYQWSITTDASGNPLPVAKAITYLTSTLGEATWNTSTQTWSSPSFAPGSLNYSVTGASASVHSQLLQKSNGDFYLLLWNDVTVYNQTTWSNINNAPVNVTLNLGTNISASTISTMNSDGTYSTVTGTITGSPGSQTMSLGVPDSVLLVKLTPANGLVATQHDTPAYGSIVAAANVAGQALGQYAAEPTSNTVMTYSGGPVSTTAAIDAGKLGVQDAAPLAVYQTARTGLTTYDVASLTPGRTYKVRLQFADFASTAAGQRQFDVLVNGTMALVNFDVYAVAGGQNKAVFTDVFAVANSDGKIIVQTQNDAAGTAVLNGIAVLDQSQAIGHVGWVGHGTNTSGHTPAAALDGDVNTYWTTNVAQAANQSYTLDLGSKQTFNRVLLTPPAGVTGTTGPVSYQLTVSNDLSAYSVALASGVGAGNNPLEISFPTMTARYIQITQTGAGGTPWGVAEFDVYNGQSALDIGGPVVKGTSTFDGSTGTYTISAGGTGIAATVDQTTFVAQPVSGDQTLIAEVTGETSSDAFAQAGVMLRNSDVSNSAEYSVYATAGGRVYFSKRATNGGVAAVSLWYGTTPTATPPSTTAPIWVKLVHSGNNFTGFYATTIAVPGAADWHQISGVASGEFSSTTTLAGLFASATSGTVAAPNVATLKNFSLVSPWTQNDVSNGTLLHPGIAGYDSATGTFTIDGSAGESELPDQYNFVSESVTGSQTIVAEITSIASTPGQQYVWAKSGIQFRNSTDGNDQMVDVVTDPFGRIGMAYRATSGATLTYYTTSTTPVSSTSPLWLKLVKSGNTFMGYYASVSNTPLASDWHLITTDTVGFTNGAFLAGLVVNSKFKYTYNQVTFVNVSITPNATVGLNRTGWTASASSTASGSAAANAVDASTTTAWSTASNQTGGEWFQLDLGTAQTFDRLVMNSGTGSLPAGYAIYVSNNGTDWSTDTALATGTTTGSILDVGFTPITARYVRILQTGALAAPWSIADLNVYA